MKKSENINLYRVIVYIWYCNYNSFNHIITGGCIMKKIAVLNVQGWVFFLEIKYKYKHRTLYGSYGINVPTIK